MLQSTSLDITSPNRAFSLHHHSRKTSATSQWSLYSEKNDMTAVTKKPHDARTAAEGDSLVQLTFGQKTAGEQACERSKPTVEFN